MQRYWHTGGAFSMHSQLILVLALMGLECAPALGQEMTWLPNPTFEIADVLKVSPRVKIQGNFGWHPEELDPNADAFAWGLRRVSIEGTALTHLGFEVERDFDDGGKWTDVYIDIRRFPVAQVQTGKFKIPFSLDELTSSTALNFVNRSMFGRDLAPGRDVGLMLHGRAFDAAAHLTYDVGLFRHDGERSRFGENPGAGGTFAGRVGLRPFATVPDGAAIRTLTVAGNLTTGIVPEGLNSLRARTVGGAELTSSVYVNGRRTRIGADALWEPGPYSLRAEWNRVSESRDGQGNAGEDLPSAAASGWYVALTWAVTGEKKAGGLRPAAPFMNGGIGALEVAWRYEQLRVDAGRQPPFAPIDPRSPTLSPLRASATTFGVNWHLNRWSRLQLNVVRETVDPAETSPIPGQTAFWSTLLRLQFVL
jgi:phosphate-selective porin OprO/OprP